jgi:hypothetical protein
MTAAIRCRPPQPAGRDATLHRHSRAGIEFPWLPAGLCTPDILVMNEHLVNTGYRVEELEQRIHRGTRREVLKKVCPVRRAQNFD